MKRDNEYYLQRLRREGRGDLVEQINSGEISVYKAAIDTGLRRRSKAPSRSEQLRYHWSRASAFERRRFVIENIRSLGPLVATIAQAIRAQRNV